MERARFQEVSGRALERIDAVLGALEHEALDVQLGGDVLTLAFSDGTRYIINAHSAASQVWMAAERNAWHFDYVEDTGRWIAQKTGDELMATVSRVVAGKLGTPVEL
ncbi:MAG TPA: iron donor protein CyaY [Nannocystaceae bacterium]|nr:iron donor protein CyaY [Nannocystaceae bacterium]